MLNLELVFEELKNNGITFFTGVPDSYLDGFCNYVLQHMAERNIIAANEGNAIGIATGHYLASKEIPLVYMQNSGLGNAVNPLVSLVNEEVYGIPMLLLIGWRGQPGTGDWAQHDLQGRITPSLLELMQIPFSILDDDNEKISSVIEDAVTIARKYRKPYALIVPKKTLAGEKVNCQDNSYPLSREEAIEIILDCLPQDTIYSATTGRATRELFFLRERRNESKNCDFLNIGSMGHASSIALSIALEQKDRRVVCLDGDAAAIMHMGALTMVSKIHCPNFLHVLLNNGAHESVGGQPSVGHLIDFSKIAEACGYQTIGKPVFNKDELTAALNALQDADRASFIDIRVHKGLASTLPPLDFSHREAIDNLIEELNSTK